MMSAMSILSFLIRPRGTYNRIIRRCRFHSDVDGSGRGRLTVARAWFGARYSDGGVNRHFFISSAITPKESHRWIDVDIVAGF